MSNRQIMQVIRELSAETSAFFEDIKKQQKATVDFKNAYMELLQIFNSSNDAIRIIDRDYNILQINDAMAVISGCQKEIAGTKCFEVCGGALCLTPNCPLTRILRGEGRVETETVIEGRQGNKINCIITAAPLRDADGEITGIVETVKDITERRRAEERLNYLAYHDHLTGLRNRTCFLDRLRLELARAKRYKRMLAVMYLDLDGFKSVNDRMGHAEGDQLLKLVADRLAKSVRASDTVARMGGDEFAILLTELNRPKDAATYAKKLLALFKQPWLQDGPQKGQRFAITVSIGIAMYPGDGEDCFTLMLHADKAMYRAKKKGSSYQFFNLFLNNMNTIS